MRTRRLALALLAWCLTPAIEGQLDSAYYGLSIGELDYSNRAAGLGGKLGGSTESWRVMIGYQFLKHFAFEGTYGKTGTVVDAAQGLLPSNELRFDTELSKILGFRALGTVPFDNGLSLIAGGGFVYIEQYVALSINGAPFLSGDIDRGGQLTYYLGAQYDWERVAVRLSYEKLDFNKEAAVIFVGADAHEVALAFFYKL
jgi:hypothetical protein